MSRSARTRVHIYSTADFTIDPDNGVDSFRLILHLCRTKLPVFGIDDYWSTQEMMESTEADSDWETTGLYCILLERGCDREGSIEVFSLSCS